MTLIYSNAIDCGESELWPKVNLIYNVKSLNCSNSKLLF